jgi:hypothetical protein
MQELLLGSWGLQIAAFARQNPLQLVAVGLTAVSIALTLIFGVREFGSGDPGGSRACPQLSQMTAAARWIAARKFLAVLS